MLRVFLSGPPQADRAERWVRCSPDGRPVERGTDVPARWPDAPIEAVLAAERVRLVALALPPMPATRVRAAARFALEDQLATSADESAIALGGERAGVRVAAVTSEALLRSIALHERRIRRIVPESALAPRTDGWLLCASAAGNAFVRRADGSAFAVDRIADDALPPELAAALVLASRAANAPSKVHVALPCEAAQLARWTQAAGVPFIPAPEWSWERATPAEFAAAPDFLAREERGDARASQSAPGLKLFRPALSLLALAAIVHFGALLAQWTWVKVENWRTSRALMSEAVTDELPDAATPEAAAAAIERRYAELRHRASLAAPGDALPLLARAAPALGALPAGALRSARYSGGSWTLELGKLDAGVGSRLEQTLASAGLDAVAAPTSGGTRMRLTLAATAR